MFFEAQALESRRLLASSLVINGLDVDIVGTNGAESISISVTRESPPFSASAIIWYQNKRFSLDPARAQDYRFHIWGKGGDDRINCDCAFASMAELTIHGGRGNDTISLNASATGPTLIHGDAGDDSIYTAADGTVTVYGDAGRDLVSDVYTDALIYCGPGNDRVWAREGNDTIYGEAGNDVLLGMDGNDNVYGGAGNDLIDGGAGDDRLFGNEGQDTLIGQAGDNFLRAGPGRGELYPASPPHKLRHLIESLLEKEPYLTS